MQIFLLETATSGHHLSYLRIFVKAINELNHKLTIVSPASYEEVIGDSFKGDRSKIEVIAIKKKLQDFNGGGILALRRHIRKTWMFLRDMVDDTIKLTDNYPDLVFFPMIDSYIGPYVLKEEIDYIFPYRWSGLYMKPQNIILKPSYSLIRKHFLNPNHILQSKYCSAMGIFMEPCASMLSEQIKKPVFIFPDMVDKSEPNINSNIIKEILKEANGRKIVSLIGSLDKRKGILNLIQVAKIVPVDKLFFVFAGECSKSSFTDDEVMTIQNFKLPNVYVHLQRIPDECIFNGIISISDLVYAAYIDFKFSSNLIGKAALFRKPIIVTDNTYMSYIVKKYNLGRCVKEGEANMIKEEILFMTSEQYLIHYTLSNKSINYTSDNSYDQFLFTFKKLLENLTFN